jgi:hypothetical protein
MALASPVAAAQAAAGRERAVLEVADVVRRYGGGFLKAYPTSPQQRTVLRAIANCRTAALGGHVEQCDHCSHRRISYNSCRNRHCPKCQGQARAKWMAAEQALLLPVPYFHVVFTLPHLLNPLVRFNQRRLYELLFHAAASTLQEFAHRHLGAELGITMVLHTWGQTLTEHVHVHCVVTGGGLGLDRSRWVPTRRPNFLFPVLALSRLFRGKYLARLQRAYARGQLRFGGQCASFAEPQDWQSLLSTLRQADWVVYAKPPFGGPEQVLKYLSRYTHRVAISNHRLRSVGHGAVRFAYKEYSDGGRTKEMTLQAEEFLRRLLLHVVPRGFMRIRHYGITANRQRAQKLARCRELLHASDTDHQRPAPVDGRDSDPRALDLQTATKCCPLCGGTLRVVEVLTPQPHDTS